MLSSTNFIRALSFRFFFQLSRFQAKYLTASHRWMLFGWEKIWRGIQRQGGVSGSGSRSPSCTNLEQPFLNTFHTISVYRLISDSFDTDVFHLECLDNKYRSTHSLSLCLFPALSAVATMQVYVFLKLRFSLFPIFEHDTLLFCFLKSA